MVVSAESSVARARHFVLAPDRRARPLNVVGTQVTVLASNAATQSYGITLQRGDEGTGPPPHSHDWDEAFYVLSGEIQFLCDRQAHVCLPGTLVHIPRGTVHGFQYGKGGGQMLEITGENAWGRQTSRSCCRCSSRTGSLSPVRPKGARMEGYVEVVLLAQNAKCRPSREMSAVCGKPDMSRTSRNRRV
jgi:quercetin dioxygenase-like cupin family protein